MSRGGRLAPAMSLLVAACVLGAPHLSAVEVIKIRPAAPTDESLAAEVTRVISGRPGVDVDDVEVEVRDSSLRLKGRVRDLYDRSEVERLASAVRGLGSIENLLEVEAIDTPDSLLELNSKRALESSPRMTSFRIQVSVAGAAATLTGEVPLARDRLEAERLVSRVAGLQSLDNQVRVAQAPIDPAIIRRRLERLLGDKLIFGGVEELVVEVSESGLVTIRGFVISHLDRLRAERLAYGLRGVTEVRNGLVVRRSPDGLP